MEVTEKRQTAHLPAKTDPNLPEKFIPTGAIAFFIALIILGLVIWYGIYLIMLARV